MQIHPAQKTWEDYRDQELKGLSPILNRLGFELDETQVHIGGERYLFSGKKLVLIGKRVSDGQSVVIKASSDRAGAAEIKREFECLEILEKIKFAYHILFFPGKILFKRCGAYTVFITAFIEQERSFLERPLEEQFFLALKVFEAQEGVHATTYEHARVINRAFGEWDAAAYLKKFNADAKDIISFLPENQEIKKLFLKAREFLVGHSEVIDLYSGFLAHWDFVPHNFRVVEHDIYILDSSSMRFGNKYEGWARFVNFMVLHNPLLVKALLGYLQKNRIDEEFLSLKLMRVLRLTELIHYYVGTLPNTLGNLHILNRKRVALWVSVLGSVLDDVAVEPKIIDGYKRDRDSLRDEAEKKRQKNLH